MTISISLTEKIFSIPHTLVLVMLVCLDTEF